MCLKTVKLASTGYLDGLPDSPGETGRAFRDKKLEAELLEASRKIGYGAQFGGKYFAHDVRVVRLPRHGASAPIGMGLSCSADRNILARIDKDGLWLEEMDRDPGRLIPAEARAKFSSRSGCVSVDLNQPMKSILAELSKHPIGTRLSLNGRIVVARDIAHSKFKELLDSGKELPEYLKKHPVYYAGPAKQPKGKPSGSFGPTTAGRMDSYVDRRFDGDDSQGQPLPGRHRRLQKIRRLLPRLAGRPRGASGREQYQESGNPGLPGAGHGGRLGHRCRGFPRLRPGGRQGRRLL